MTMSPDTRLRPVTRAALVLAGTAALAACGSVAAPSSSPGSSGSSPSSAAGTSSPAKVALTMTIRSGQAGQPRVWTLRCDPDSGTHPHPAVACATLLRIHNLFSPTPAHRMCPMVVASAKRVTLTGTWFGKKVNRTIIDGGCDLATFSKLGEVVR
jgi:hypothetical protein